MIPVGLKSVSFIQAGNPPDVERCKLCSAYREASAFGEISSPVVEQSFASFVDSFMTGSSELYVFATCTSFACTLCDLSASVAQRYPRAHSALPSFCQKGGWHA